MKTYPLRELIGIAGLLSDEDIAMNWSALNITDVPALTMLFAAVREFARPRCRCGLPMPSPSHYAPYSCSCGRHYAMPTIDPHTTLERLDELQRKHDELLKRLAEMGTEKTR